MAKLRTQTASPAQAANAARAARRAVTPAQAVGPLPGGNTGGGDQDTPPSQFIAQLVRGSGLAPWPVIDRTPILIGQHLSLSYVAACYRTALSGYRMQLVDLLNELLQKEPHGYAVLWKRVLGTAGARLTVELPEWVDEADPEYEKAEAMREFCERQIKSIPRLRQHLAFLAWATYYAVTGLEIHWDRDTSDAWAPRPKKKKPGQADLPAEKSAEAEKPEAKTVASKDSSANGMQGLPGARWIIKRLSSVNSRRLSYPDWDNWDLHVWDQGQVLGSYQAFGNAPTNAGYFGLRVADFPHKFVIHAPQLRGDYPTREGVGIQLTEWFVFKRLGARMAAQYLERWGKPFMDIAFNTGEPDEGNPQGKPRAADEPDIAAAQAAAGALGAGALSSWVHPDCVTTDIKMSDKGKKAITFQEWLEFCNGEISKPVLGGTMTTDVGAHGGNRALGEVHADEETKILEYDAQAMCDTLDEQLIGALVTLNYGRESLRLAPHCRLHVTDPDPAALVTLAVQAASGGIAVDGDALGEEVGLPLVENTRGKPRRMFPIKPIDPAMVDEDVGALQAEKDDKDRAAASEMNAQRLQAMQRNPDAAGAGAPPGAPGALPGAKRPDAGSSTSTSKKIPPPGAVPAAKPPTNKKP